ncbi:hypothetical protein BH23VER1_BH23VER1_36300 [soil metagenome]
MDVHVATLCDSAMDYNGKLCVLGTFDTICSRSAPVVHPQCSLALRICFKAGDEGQHKLSIKFIDGDGKLLMPAFEPMIEIKLPADGYFVTRNIVLNLQRLKFENPGQFSIDVSADDEMLTRVPLRVMLVEG